MIVTIKHGFDTRRLADAVARADAYSPFLRRALRRNPDVAPLLEGGLADVLRSVVRADPLDPDFAATLRHEREAVALAIALVDLAGASLETVTRALTDFADSALDRAIAAAFHERMPLEPPRGFVALALGKQGSRELNYSSDIDPILLFDPTILPHRAREEPGEAAVRLARRIVSLLQDRTAEGYVLRVDLRLRPAAEATPLAVPIDVAISHYESSALPWERAAFIRARSAAGDIAMGERFLMAIRPFVWRRALDFGALADIQALSQRIRSHHAQGQHVGPGFDLKRGRGGIREVEFFAQIHQLIHGGRNPAVRVPATLDALQALADVNLVAIESARALSTAYRTLRTTEHRLQMMEDAQTHRLPTDGAILDDLAQLHHCQSGTALIDMLTPLTEMVGHLYDGLAVRTKSFDREGMFDGFADAPTARAMIARWRTGGARSTRSDAARAALDGVLPVLVAALVGSPCPDAALVRFGDLIDNLPTAINLFRLLEARPGLLEQLAKILSYAPALARELARRSDLLDGLIDATAFDAMPSVDRLIADLGSSDGTQDYEEKLDRLRVGVGERRFQLGVQLVTGGADPLEVGAGYGRVADAAITVAASAAVAEFETAHGQVPGGELVMLALGRLGGGVLTHASDLDVVFLFTGDFLAESDGRRPLGATIYFNRLAQRVIAALSVPTAVGPLYHVDTRLRPSGAQGLLAVSIDSFARYQAESAWTWEHMALTRARPIFGSAAAREALAKVIGEALSRRPDADRIRGDATKMRGDIAAHKPPAGPLDVKLEEGGLVDAEFTIQVLQLVTGIGIDPNLAAAAQAMQKKAGLVAPGFAIAIDLLTRMLITLRLVAPNLATPDAPTCALVAQSCGYPDWNALEIGHTQARTLIAGEWRRVAGLV